MHLLLLLAPSALAQSIYGKFAEGTHRYLVIGSCDWHTCAAFAVAHGGHLATIDGEAGDRFAAGLVHLLVNAMLIGLTDEVVEDSFGWVSGSTASYRRFA